MTHHRRQSAGATGTRPGLRWQWRALALALGLAGCSGSQPEPDALAPPRVATPIDLPLEQSLVVVPVRIPLSQLTRAAEAAIPRTLWAIDKPGVACIKAARARIGAKRVKLTPDIKCTLVGTATRGPVTVRSAGPGGGNGVRLYMPVNAQIGARNVAGVLKETAHASAMVTADIDFGIIGDWKPSASVRLSYDWRDPPHIEILGQRIDLTSPADPRLQAMLLELERKLPQELDRLDLKRVVQTAWRAGFTNISVNRDNPPVWMRVTPTALGYAGHRIVGDELELRVALAATTEGFVGERPDKPIPTPLPPPSRPGEASGLRLSLPIVVDYRELEPIVLRALTRLNSKGIVLPGLGRVEARFLSATIYPTEGGRVAVGIKAEAWLAKRGGRPVRGVAWLSAIPVNAPNSARIEWQDLQVAAQTDRPDLNLLTALFGSDLVREELRRALALNLEGDYAKLLGKARAAIANKQVGDMQLVATIHSVSHGQLVAAGQGLFLPVAASGAATLRYAPSSAEAGGPSRPAARP
jgi:hypothetical protein